MNQFRDWLFNVGKAIIVIQVIALAIIVTMTVIARYVLNFTFPWSEEIARYLLIWIGLVGAALGVAAKSHLGFEYIYTRLTGLWRLAVQLAINLSISVFALGMLAYGLKIAYFFREDTMESLRIGMYWVYSAMPVSGLMILVFNAAELLDIIGPARHSRGDR